MVDTQDYERQRIASRARAKERETARLTKAKATLVDLTQVTTLDEFLSVVRETALWALHEIGEDEAEKKAAQ